MKVQGLHPFGAWLRTRRAAILCVLSIPLIFFTVFFLYQIPTEVVAYASALALLPVIGIAAWDFAHFRSRFVEYARMAHCADLPDYPLPPAQNPAEAVIQSVLLAQRDALIELDDALRRERADMLDYYTAWVHQIKTPIAAVRMLLEGEDLPSGRRVRAELTRIEAYADMALHYQRLENPSGDISLKYQPLEPIIRRAVRQYAPLMVQSHIRLAVEANGVCALTDAKWLQFILEQLLSNAVKYAAEKTLTITATPQPSIMVRDTGIGIDAADLPRIFEKGFTGMNGRNVRGATGLGLYLCKKSANMLGHELSVQSAPGEGASFTLSLHTPNFHVE